MTYFEGFLVPVPSANREAYRQHAADAAPIFHDLGVTRHVEAWGDDLPDGKTTDFRKAVQAKDDEEVVFSWFEYPSREVRDEVFRKMRDDPRMKAMGDSMPFDGKRMIIGGFESIVEEGTPQGGPSTALRTGYFDGFVLPVLPGKRDAYRDLAARAAPIFREHGAKRVVEAMENDVPKGDVTDFYRAVKAEEGETIVFSFIEWPSKEARDSGWKALMEDERMKPEGDMPFDGPRMFWGGFTPVLDSIARQPADA